MHEIYSALPVPALRPFVRAYAERDLRIGGSKVVEPVPVRLEQTLEFEFADSFLVELTGVRHIQTPTVAVVGSHTRGTASITLTGSVRSFAIFFHPSGLSRLFNTPMSLLTDQAFEATSVLGSGVRCWWNELGEAPSFSARVAIIEQKLLNLRSDERARPQIADRILAARGMTGIHDLARDAHCSVRQFQRRFLLETGITPKFCNRIARFQTALDAKVANPKRSWLSIAHARGYFDQMHMIQDFKKITGYAPSALFAELGDTRPDALAKAAPPAVDA